MFTTLSDATTFESLALARRPQLNESNMKKALAKKNNDELRPEYDLSKLKRGIRGKYYRQATAGTNLVLIEPDLSEVFPDAESVNRALRLLAETAKRSAVKKSESKRTRLRNTG